jgi:phosphoribosylanthranilate isomerase
VKRVLIKICGITTVGDGLMAAEAGADAVGFVFYPMSPRRMTAERAAAVARELPPLVLRVGVFVNASRDEMARVADAVGLDLLQLHGDEPPVLFEQLPRRALKALRVGKGFAPKDALEYEGHAAGLLVDTRAPGDTMMPGGTGKTFDWTLVEEVRAGARFLMLAGGLSAENVAEAIGVVRPDAVDVSSGVEGLPGRKDAERVRAFVEAVRGAAAGMTAGSRQR